MSTNTKRVNLTPAFMKSAEADKQGALAYMLMAAFGVALVDLVEIARSAIDNNEMDLMMMALAAAVQIRGNVVFVGSEFAGIRGKYPTLIIEGERSQQDVFNYSALHCLGHVLAGVSRHKLAQRILAKAGNAITGSGTNASPAGVINKQIADSWSPDDVSYFNDFAKGLTDKQKAILDNLFDGVSKQATNFRTSMTATTSVPAPATIVKPPPKPPATTTAASSVSL